MFALSKEKIFLEYSHKKNAFIHNLKVNKMYFTAGKRRDIFQFKDKSVTLKIITWLKIKNMMIYLTFVLMWIVSIAY